jgi:phage gp29-like protein
MLYDAYGREVAIGRLKEEQAGPTVAGVRNIYSVMHPAAGLTPEKLTGVLQQAEFGDPFQYLELAEEMEEKDLHYLAVLNTRKQAVAQLELVIRAASSAAADVRLAEMATEYLLKGALNLRPALYDMLDAIGKGFSATEIMWEMSGSSWYPAQLLWRDPRWFLFDWVSGRELLVRTLQEENQSVAIEREAGYAHLDARLLPLGRRRAGDESSIGRQPLTAPLAPFKFIVHYAQAKSGLPIRGGIARAAAWAYLFKNYILKDWVTYAEVFGQPLRLGKYGAGATEADKSALLQAVANIGTDAAAIIPDSMLIEFNQARQSGSTELYERFCDFLDRQVSKAVLGQTLTTELPRGGGSRAAAQVHQAVRRDILGADALRLEATLTRDLIKPLIDLNAGPQARYPQVQLALPDDQDVKVFAEIVAELADRGLRISQRSVLDRLGLEEPREDDAVLRARGLNNSQLARN